MKTNTSLQLWAWTTARLFFCRLREDHRGISLYPRGSGSQGLKALLVMLGVCLAGDVWEQDLQVPGHGKIREKLR